MKNKEITLNSKIEEISNQTGISFQDLNKIIFGEELFYDKLSNHPLVKFKRDIAKDIGIKDVI